MLRLLVALAGVILLALTALAVIWLAGQVLAGLGLVAVGTAGVLFKLLWFLLVAGLLGGLVFFVTSAWRPAGRNPARRTSTEGVNLAGAASAVIPDEVQPEVIAVITADPELQVPDAVGITPKGGDATGVAEEAPSPPLR